MRRSSTETLIAACKELAATVQCDDGVANEALREIAERLEELSKERAEMAAALRNAVSMNVTAGAFSKWLAEPTQPDFID